MQRTTTPSVDWNKNRRTLAECAHIKYQSASWYVASCHQTPGPDIISSHIQIWPSSLGLDQSLSWKIQKFHRTRNNCLSLAIFNDNLHHGTASPQSNLRVCLSGYVVSHNRCKPIMVHFKVPWNAQKWLNIAILDSDLLQITVHHPLSFRSIDETLTESKLWRHSGRTDRWIAGQIAGRTEAWKDDSIRLCRWRPFTKSPLLQILQSHDFFQSFRLSDYHYILNMLSCGIP